MNQDAVIWILEKTIMMVTSNWKTYPVRRDAALFIMTLGTSKQVSFSDVEKTLNEIIAINKGNNVIGLDYDADKYSVRVDITTDGFTLNDARKMG